MVLDLDGLMPAFSKIVYRSLTRKSNEGEEKEDQVAANFVKLLTARFLSKVGDHLASPKTTLAWLLQSLGAPPVFTGLIVPLRESGSLLPQVALANYLKRFEIRKWAWSIGALIQGLAIAGCSVVALTLSGGAAGMAIVGLVALFALARGVSSISAKDLLGKTIPKSKRGQLTGWAGSLSGVISLVAASILLFAGNKENSVETYAVNMAEGNKRTDYVATGNTLIGIFLLVAGLLSGGASMISIDWALGGFAVMALAGGLYAARLKVH